jgi:hypothetical protein
MPRLWPHLRRAPRQPARGFPARHALGRDPAGLDLPGLLGAREARLHEGRRLNTSDGRARRGRGLRWGALLLALAAVAGCSSIKFGYNRLDWLVSWQIGKFVDLDREQKELVAERLGEAWRWHRGTQLTLYVRDLRELAATLEKPLDAAQVERYLNLSQDHAGRALNEITPDVARVLGTFSDAQVRELLDNMAERRAERAEESAGLTAEQLREKAQEQMLKGLKRWIGPATRDQHRRIVDWSSERQYAGTIWQQYEEAWAAAFTEVLLQRGAPDFEQQLGAMFNEARVPYTDEMERVQQHNRKLWIGLMADLSASLTAEQRKRLRARVAGLADDFDDLAGQAAPQPANASARL